VSSFERNITTKYIQNIKNPPKSSSAFEILDFKMTLNYKRSLIDLWKGLEKNRKKKVFCFDR